MKILLFGDIVGRVGREAVKLVLPELREKYSPDLTIANGENLAHGKGVTSEVLSELLAAGIDVFTSGNHVWDRKEVFDVFADARLSDKLMRPANYPPGTPGEGAKFLTIATKNVLVLNLLGRVFSRVDSDDPFRAADEILKSFAPRRPQITLVDFHAEATSEKAALAWHLAGRVTAVWGTHTHVPTRDERILPGGTGFVTDLGMCGLADGIIGMEREPIISSFLTQLPMQFESPASGPAVVNAMILTVEAGKTTAMEPYQKYLTVN